MKKNHPSITPACASCELATFDRACVTEAGKSSKGCPTFARKKVLEDAGAVRCKKSLFRTRTIRTSVLG